MSKKKDVHTEHCCKYHGCKYGEEECSVVTGLKEQSFPCERCEDDKQEFDYQSKLFFDFIKNNLTISCNKNYGSYGSGDYTEIMLHLKNPETGKYEVISSVSV